LKKIANLLLMLLLLYITLQILINSSEVTSSILFSFEIFKTNVFPNLFPFLIISGLLINYGFVEICSNIFSPIMKKVFKISGNTSFIFIMSLLTGFPSNSKYTKELYLSGLINSKEATKILMFTHFSNPLFIIGTISTFLNSKIALIILFCHYITNIIIGIIFRNYNVENNKNKTIIKSERKNFGIALSSSITSSINTLLLIFGTITVFLIITTLINDKLNLPDFYKSIINGIFEMTQGLKSVSLLNINMKFKAVLMTMFLSFGGISIHMQVLSIISDTNIKYLPFFLSRIIHSIIAGSLVYLII